MLINYIFFNHIFKTTQRFFKKMLKSLLKISFLLILLITSSCILVEPMPSDWNWGLKPRPLTGVKNFPSAKTEYGKGFRDGC